MAQRTFPILSRTVQTETAMVPVPETLVASLMVLRQKLHGYHWEVTGPNFLELHRLFENQYTQILEYADRVAEYLRSTGNGLHPPSTMKEMVELSILIEHPAKDLTSQQMITDLFNDFLVLSQWLEEAPNYTRAWSNIIDELQEYLRKQVWFLRSYLDS